MRKSYFEINIFYKIFFFYFFFFFYSKYREHAKELGNKVPDENPLIFSKPISTIITQGSTIEIPNGWNELHHEVELGDNSIFFNI